MNLLIGADFYLQYRYYILLLTIRIVVTIACIAYHHLNLFQVDQK